ncbi:MAG: hypothetical protein NTY36_08660 [Deltaproteobacteria bacterium]|nr:hypothetical protein [Deltaproteobacteria bacterium]
MAEEFLYQLDLWLILAASIGLFLLGDEIGFRIGRRKRPDIDEDARSQVITVQGAMLGLLALLLGFTFSMAMSRFEVRKQQILEESNAIGTTYLRAQLMPEPQRKEVSALLRRYVEARLKFYQAGMDRERFQEARGQTERLQLQLWSQAAAWGDKEPRAIPAGLFLQSLNETIDLHSKGITALENHVPEIILVLLYFVALAATGLIGYGAGLAGRRNFVVTMVASILIAAVILVIIDLDRPHQGLIKVGLGRMVELRSSLNQVNLETGGTAPGPK